MANGGRRGAILQAAKLEFEKHGRAGARIDRIAADARVNKQLIFHYFQSKDGLYEAVLGDVLIPMAAAPEQGGTPAEALKAAATALDAIVARSPGLALALAECAHASQHADKPSRMAGDWTSQALAYVGSAVSDGQRLGFFRDDTDVQFVAKTMVSAIVGGLILDRHSLVGQQGSVQRREQSVSSFATEIGRLLADDCAWR